MRRFCTALGLLVVFSPAVGATGLLIPTEKKVPPLAMLNHQVNITIDDQVAVTRVEQTFRNHTDRPLEATYVFPVPKGASVRKFSMWVDGKEVSGELVEAKKAREIYTSIVQRTQDPGLLEYLGNDLLQVKVFPVPAKGDQKLAVSYTSLAQADNGLVEFVYPLKTDNKAVRTLEKFSINLQVKSQHAIQNIYSPTHAITISRPNDNSAVVGFEKDQAILDRDFQLFYTAGSKDVGLTVLTHRPNPSQNGHFMLLVSPRAELSKSQQVPRDMVFVLDTSGSMRGKRMTQAQNALKYCLKNLTPHDRFAMMNFATTVNKYANDLQSANADNIVAAVKWVDALEATGGTAIDDALAAAIDMRTKDESRTYTIVFFTDGRPTIGETAGEKILQNVQKRNSANTRIFTFGVGDDVNAALLDQLADSTRAISTYVRETEDIEVKVSSLYSKISNPVLANLKLSVSGGVTISEIYPPQLPDLFHGSQLVIMGRYQGASHAAIKLNGQVGKDAKEFVYEINFPNKTGDDKAFVEDLWARRKVGYLLDQIRINGEKKELVDEVVTLAKRHGITTPYTSYLLVPDSVIPTPKTTVAKTGTPPPGLPDVRFNPTPGDIPAALTPPSPSGGTGGPTYAPVPLETFLKGLKDDKGGKNDLTSSRGKFTGERLEEAEKLADKLAKEGKEIDPSLQKIITEARVAQTTLDQAKKSFADKDFERAQNGQLGVDLALQNQNLRNETRLRRTASRNIQNRNIIEIGGIWIDDAFDPKMETITIKAMSKAYFRLLELHPEMREVYQLGNHVVWVTPSRQALVIDQGSGRETMADADIARLFKAPKAAK